MEALLKCHGRNYVSVGYCWKVCLLKVPWKALSLRWLNRLLLAQEAKALKKYQSCWFQEIRCIRFRRILIKKFRCIKFRSMSLIWWKMLQWMFEVEVILQALSSDCRMALFFKFGKEKGTILFSCHKHNNKIQYCIKCHVECGQRSWML